jgi:plasmid stabilization system protein ParE
MPDTYRTIIRPQAATDLERVFAYIEQHSPQNARKVAGRLIAAVDSLEILPRRHKVHSSSRDRSRVVRSMSVRPYIVYYRVLEPQKAVEVLTIWHGSRRQPRRFK